MLDRHAVGLDAARPDAVERRRRTGHRTAPGERRRPPRRRQPGRVRPAGDRRPAPAPPGRRAHRPHPGRRPRRRRRHHRRRAPSRVLSYDYTVLAGTQGLQNHRKKDRLFELIERQRLPVVFFAEGGGGRPGDTDGTGVSGLDCLAFWLWGGLSGLVPMVGITTRPLLRRQRRHPRLLRRDHRHRGLEHRHGRPGHDRGRRPRRGRPRGDRAARRPGRQRRGRRRRAPTRPRPSPSPGSTSATSRRPQRPGWTAPRPGAAARRRAREPAPGLRRAGGHRAALADDDSRARAARRASASGWSRPWPGSRARPLGIVANNPTHLAGAIDADGATKAAQFLAALRRPRPPGAVPVRHARDHGRGRGREAGDGAPRPAGCSSPAPASASPFGTIVLRKGYGLGAQAMAGGSFKAPLFCIAWPTGEFGGDGPRRARAARLPQGARGHRRSRPSGRRPSRRWSTGCTSTARRSTPPATSRSTT